MKDQRIVLVSPESSEECDRKLKRLEATPSAASIFSTHEINFPEVHIESDAETFIVEQNKSYVNPWGPQAEISLIPKDHGTRVEGRIRYGARLYVAAACYYAGMATGIVGTLWLIRYWVLTRGQRSDVLLHSLSIAFVVFLTAALAYARYYCERHYTSKGRDEREFLMHWLHETFQAPPSVLEIETERQTLPEDRRVA